MLWLSAVDSPDSSAWLLSPLFPAVASVTVVSVVFAAAFSAEASATELLSAAAFSPELSADSYASV